MIGDARELEGGERFEADVCVVGAGAAGITVTRELAAAGSDVVLLESGGRGPDEDTQALYDLESVGYPIRERFMSRARYYGGSCNLWAGRSMRLSAEDLAQRPWVPSSGWPLDPDELADYYPRAAEILRLPPMERFEPASHLGRMTEPERALFSDGSVTPTVSLWAPRPKRFGSAFRRDLRRARNVRALLHANAVHLRLSEEGSAVDVLDAAVLGGPRFRVAARHYVLAAGGLENPRLLLASNDRFPAGVGNGHDQVGRYFMDHPRAPHGSVRLLPSTRLRALQGVALRDGKVQIGVGISEERQREEGLLDHYATLEAHYSQYAEARYQSFVQAMKVLLRRGYAGKRTDVGRAGFGDIPGMIYLLTPKELMPFPLYRAWVALRDRVRPVRGGGVRTVVYFCEQPPDPESRVTLGRARDALGMNRLVLDWRVGAEVTRSLLRLQELLKIRLEAAGVGILTEGEGEPRYTDASHHIGTTRMSRDPKVGVVDPDCRVHGVANLFVAGSSVFPSASHANPTLTIVALALRLAERLRG